VELIKNKQAAQHRVQRTSAGCAALPGIQTQKSESTFGFFPPIPALAANARRWAG